MKEKIKIKELKNALNLSNKDEKDVFITLLDYDENTELTKEEIKEKIEKKDITELAEELVDVYTIDLLKWYEEDINRVFYIDEVLKLGSETSGFSVLAGGQFFYWQEKLEKVKEKIEKYLGKNC